MIHRLPALFRGLNKHPKIIPRRLLPDKFGEAFGTQSGVEVFGPFVGGGEAVRGHLRCYHFSSQNRLFG